MTTLSNKRQAAPLVVRNLPYARLRFRTPGDHRQVEWHTSGTFSWTLIKNSRQSSDRLATGW
jgi:hypothetical protein